MLNNTRVDLSNTVLLEEAPSIAPVSTEGASATITEYRFNEMHIAADLASPAILVLSEVYYPDWNVEIDGEPGNVIRANHVLRAVALSAGEHELVFKFDSSLLRESLALSVTTLSLAVLVLLFAIVSNVRKGTQWKHS
jgi:uncharacterized membrane protein YfhO